MPSTLCHDLDSEPHGARSGRSWATMNRMPRTKSSKSGDLGIEDTSFFSPRLCTSCVHALPRGAAPSVHGAPPRTAAMLRRADATLMLDILPTREAVPAGVTYRPL
eukprot:6196029-Pleurochrysis_carterae.AAC.4